MCNATEKIIVVRQDIINFINKKYSVNPEYLWRRYPDFCVFRRDDNEKWFAIIMKISREKFQLSGDGAIDVINVKTDNVEFFLGVPGIFPAYHMNKNNWVSVLLNGTVPAGNVKKLIEMSYALVEK